MLRPAVLLAIALCAPSIAVLSTLSADAPGSCQPDAVFSNEDVRIWFQGKKGHVKVFDVNETSEEGSHYAYRTGEIVEVAPDGATPARMGLERAFPQTSECSVVETDEWVNMTLTVTDDVRVDGAPDGQATVTFRYHFNKSSQGAKFDLAVEGWPWQSEGQLAYAFDVTTSGGAIEAAENGVGFRDEAGVSKGYVEWAPTATATYDDGHTEESLVDSDVAVDGQTARVVLTFTNATAGYAALDYDPWAGVGEYAIVGGLLIGLAHVEDLLPPGVLGAARGLL